jgi:hypothetical protein
MALPDPERHISRLQAEIIPSGESFLIKQRRRRQSHRRRRAHAGPRRVDRR